jgi:hypothetical protein
MIEKDQTQIFNAISQRIRANLASVNKILAECSVESKFASQETREKFEKLFNINHEEIFNDTSSDEYYDLNAVASIFSMLEDTKTIDGNKKLKRFESVSSISSSM